MTDSVTKAEAIPTEPSSASRWNLPTVVAFRFALVYCLLQWVPLIATFNTEALTAGAMRGPNWFGILNTTVGQWVIVRALGLPEHSQVPRLSGNNLSLFVGMVGMAVVSGAVALVWSAVDRHRVGHPRLFAWSHTFMRFMLATTMLVYGWAKILPDQFAVSLDYIALEVGQHNPRDLLWAFMVGSRWYQVCAGVVEVGAGLLLLTRRTAMLGALLSMASMANVLALDVGYDAPVKFLAGQIFLITLFVLAPFAVRLVDVFALDRHPHSAMYVRRLVTPPSADSVARVVGMFVGMWIVFGSLQDIRGEIRQLEVNRQTPLYGIWDVEETIRNGASVPLLVTDTTLWRRLVVQSKDAAVIVPMSDAAPRPAVNGRSNGAVRYSVRLDNAAQTAELAPLAFYDATRRLTFSYTLPDPNHLVLTGRDGDDQAFVVRLRRFDPSNYPLLVWERSWRW